MNYNGGTGGVARTERGGLPFVVTDLVLMRIRMMLASVLSHRRAILTH